MLNLFCCHIFARNHLLLFQGVLVSDFLTFRTKNKPAVICRSLHRQQQVFPDAFIYFTIRSIPSVIRIPTHLLCLWCLLNTLLPLSLTDLHTDSLIPILPEFFVFSLPLSMLYTTFHQSPKIEYMFLNFNIPHIIIPVPKDI